MGVQNQSTWMDSTTSWSKAFFRGKYQTAFMPYKGLNHLWQFRERSWALWTKKCRGQPNGLKLSSASGEERTFKGNGYYNYFSFLSWYPIFPPLPEEITSRRNPQGFCSCIISVEQHILPFWFKDPCKSFSGGKTLVRRVTTVAYPAQKVSVDKVCFSQPAFQSP